jgi:phosphoglycolate phosphatase-like HAD superfamily hydrolase
MIEAVAAHGAGDTVDDIRAATGAGIKGLGVVAPGMNPLSVPVVVIELDQC